MNLSLMTGWTFSDLDWLYIDDEEWSRVEQAASPRQTRVRKAKPDHGWNAESHLIGISGEVAYSHASGLPWDDKVRLNGDGGRDFPNGVQVKCVGNYYDWPYLKEERDPEHGFSKFYALAIADISRRRCQLIGWTHGKTMEEAVLKDFGNGLMHHMSPRELFPFRER